MDALEEFLGVRFNVKTSAGPADGKGKPQLLINLNIDAAAVRFETASGRYIGKLELAFYSMDSSQSHYLGEPVSQALAMSLSNETYQKVLKEGISVSVPVPWIEAGQRIKVIVYSYSTDKLGIRFVQAPSHGFKS